MTWSCLLKNIDLDLKRNYCDSSIDPKLKDCWLIEEKNIRLDHGCVSKTWQKQLDFSYTLKAELSGFADDLNVGCYLRHKSSSLTSKDLRPEHLE